MADLRGDLRAERHHWLNTYVGVLDGAFWLSDEEQYFTSDIIVRLLDSLCIPERGNPKELSPPVALEVASGYYTVQLSSPRDSGLQRSPRPVHESDIIVSVEAWSQALLALITTAYPDLEPIERLVTTKVLSDLLIAIGVPGRAAAFFPDDVVRAYLDSV